MANKLLLDVNLCLDFILNRKPFSDSAGQIFQAVEHKTVEGIISAISFDTMFYVLRPVLGAPEATNRLHQLTLHTHTGTVDHRIIQTALNAGWKDLEDAIQYFTATFSECDALVTRNTKDFTPTSIPVLTPAQSISTYL